MALEGRSSSRAQKKNESADSAVTKAPRKVVTKPTTSTNSSNRIQGDKNLANASGRDTKSKVKITKNITYNNFYGAGAAPTGAFPVGKLEESTSIEKVPGKVASPDSSKTDSAPLKTGGVDAAPAPGPLQDARGEVAVKDIPDPIKSGQQNPINRVAYKAPSDAKEIPKEIWNTLSKNTVAPNVAPKAPAAIVASAPAAPGKPRDEVLAQAFKTWMSTQPRIASKDPSAPKTRDGMEYFKEAIASPEITGLRNGLAAAQEEVSKQKSLVRRVTTGLGGGPLKVAQEKVEAAKNAYADALQKKSRESFELGQQKLREDLAVKWRELTTPEHVHEEGMKAYNALGLGNIPPTTEQIFALGMKSVNEEYDGIKNNLGQGLQNLRGQLGVSVVGEMSALAAERNKLAQERLDKSPKIMRALTSAAQWYGRRNTFTKMAIGAGVATGGAFFITGASMIAAPAAAAAAILASKGMGAALKKWGTKAGVRGKERMDAQAKELEKDLAAESIGTPLGIDRIKAATLALLRTGEQTEDAVRHERRRNAMIIAGTAALVGVGTYAGTNLGLHGTPVGIPRPTGRGIAPNTEPPSGSIPEIPRGRGIAPNTEPPSGSLRDNSIFTGEAPTETPSPLPKEIIRPAPDTPNSPGSPELPPLEPSEQAYPNEPLNKNGGAPKIQPTPEDVTTPEAVRMRSTSSIDNQIDLESRVGKTFGDKYIVKPGDNLWNIISDKLQSGGKFEGLSQVQKNAIIQGYEDRLTNLGPAKLKEVGFYDGNINQIIRPGDQLDLHILDGDPLPATPKASAAPAPTGVRTGVQPPAPASVEVLATQPTGPTPSMINGEVTNLINSNLGRKGIFNFFDRIGSPRPAYDRFHSYVEWRKPAVFMNANVGSSPSPGGFQGLDNTDVLNVKATLLEGQKTYGLNMANYSTVKEAFEAIARARLSGGR